MAKVISKKAKVYEVIVTMTVKKKYTVKADSEAEAETKLAESVIVTVTGPVLCCGQDFPVMQKLGALASLCFSTNFLISSSFGALTAS